MFMDSKRYWASALNDSEYFDDLQDCIKYAAGLCKRMTDEGFKKSSCHVSIFDNAYGTLIGFVYVSRANWIRIDVNYNYLDL